jgi:hypothetical protein
MMRKEQTMTLFANRRAFDAYVRTTPDPVKLQHIVGRALVALFKRQTETERASNDTNVNNNRGFTAGDAKSGSITAKYYIKHKKLESWQVQRWLEGNERGEMRLTKYWRQINEVAAEKAKASN